jgi:hypothetical protein
VTPADLGKPIAAIVERCGAPDVVMSISTENELFFVDNGKDVSVFFDADQTRARVIQFATVPTDQTMKAAEWNITLPFESGARDIVLGKTTLSDVQSMLSNDADVTTNSGAAYRSTPSIDVVLASQNSGSVLSAAYVGERAAFVQMEMIASPIGSATLEYRAPLPLEPFLRFGTSPSGSRATIFRIDVDATGIARTVAVVIPSGDAQFDTATRQRIGDAAFRPATLGKRPVSGSVFVQVRH